MPNKVFLVALLLGTTACPVVAATAIDVDLERRFAASIRPFVDTYCVKCHGGEKPEADLDLKTYSSLASVVAGHAYWDLILEKLEAKEMPNEKAEKFPSEEARQEVIAWIREMRTNEARKNAGDPGVVLARRLSNAEYNYTIRDLTGHDLQPTREFPVDPANQAGFDNSGESLAMSPALLNKYLLAAREVANHLVFKPGGLTFAPHPMLVETDRDKYCVNQIVDFYRRQPTDLAAYFRAAWVHQHRAALGKPATTLADTAAAQGVSAKYLSTVWRALEEKEDVGPGAKLQAMWRALPAPTASSALATVTAETQKMRDWVVQLRAKLEPRFANLPGGRGIGGTSQPSLMWKNRQYATHRMSYDRDVLQIDGKVNADRTPVAQKKMTVAAADAVDEDAIPEHAPRRDGVDPDLFVPSAEREKYEAAFARFCAVFPDAFYVQERGRNYLDKSKDKGRYLSAGFHNVMGYFRDDIPLYELVLDDQGRQQLDAMWQELDFVANAATRTYVQFYFNESGEARDPSKRAEEKDVTKEPMVKALAENYLTRAKASNNPVVIQAVQDHFTAVNATLRWVERARTESEPHHLRDLEAFAARAYRRPLTDTERRDFVGFYRSLRAEAGLSHEDAVRDVVVSILMSPDFCYRIDLIDDGPGVRPLSDYALASRLSYFLWSSMPDEQLLARAAKGELRRRDVLVAEAKRMLRDPKVRGLAVEFGMNWLAIRRFEETNTVDRERFTTFTNELRLAMFEEPVRFTADVFAHNRSVLDFLFATHTFVNPALAKHYGMPEVKGGDDTWVRVEQADRYGRGGLLPMAAFLTKNAPGLRTSPVKRGYWVVKHVLGEHIPPPPAVVPELPRDESKLDLPLREMLAKHREDKSCSSCHARFDAMGVALEGYGPIGERREKDLAGRAVDARTSFPRGGEGDGLSGLRDYIREKRQEDFIDGLSRKLVGYALGRSVMLSDEPLIEQIRTDLAKNGHRAETLIESIITSPQFLNKRGRETVTMVAAE